MFMDSCAAGTHQLTKDSPSSKLLFYRDVQKYKKLAEKFVFSIESRILIIVYLLLDITIQSQYFQMCP